MDKLIQELQQKLWAWLRKMYKSQLSHQDYEDIVQETLTNCFRVYRDKWALATWNEIQCLAFTATRNEALQRIQKTKKIVVTDMEDFELYLLVQNNAPQPDIPWADIFAHPAFVKNPHFRFIFEKIIYYDGQCLGVHLYENIIDEYEERFQKRPTYENFRRIKSRAKTLLNKVMYKKNKSNHCYEKQL